MTALEQLAGHVADLMREDERRVLLGEDVIDGGMMGLSRTAVADPELRPRVRSTPLIPATLPAHAAGLAASGVHPIVLLPGVEALLEGFAALREAALWSWRNDDAVDMPLLFVAPYGPGLSIGGPAVEAPEALLLRVPGLHVLCASQTEALGAWLRAAVEHAANEGPTVLLLPRSLMLAAPEGPMFGGLGYEPAASQRVRDGEAATVFAWGDCLPTALAAVDHSGVAAAVVDVGCLAPLDWATLDAEARATGRIVIVHSGPRSGGIGAELAARFADSAILHLDAPIVRVTGRSAPMAPADESTATPTVAEVADAITRIASY